MTTTKDRTYQDLFKTKNGKTYLTELPTVAKIISGQSFLYRQQGARSMILDIRLTAEIDRQLLQVAVERSLKRYLYLTGKLIEKNGTYYLVHNTLPIVIAQHTVFRSLGTKEVNYHLIDITFKHKRLFISYHHALVDGRGILPFMKTLLYYYLSFKNGQLLSVPQINLANDLLTPDEMKEPFTNLPMLKLTADVLKKKKQKPYHLSEATAFDPQAASYRYELAIDQISFMPFAKAHNATPAIAIGIMLAQAIRRAHSESTDPVVVNLANDLRSGITYQKTFRNCVNSIAFPINAAITSNSEFTRVATAFREQIKLQKRPESIRETINSMLKLFNKLDNCTSLLEKQKMMAFFDTNLVDTFILSYSGQLKLGTLEKYINEIHTYMSGTNGLSVQMLTANQKLFIDLIQSFPSEIYVKTFIDILNENHIKYTNGGKNIFQTPHSAF